MKIQFDPIVFNKQLGLSFSIASKISTQKVVQSLFLEAFIENGKGYVSVETTNYDTSSQVKLEAEVITPGKACFSALFFSKLLKEHQGQIQMYTDQSNWVHIVSDTSQVRLPCYDAQNFPRTNFQFSEDKVQVRIKELSEAISKTLFCVSEDTSKKRLTGINFRLDSASRILNLLATDSYRASYYTISLDDQKGIERNENVIIPRSSILEVQKLLQIAETTAESDAVDIYFNEREVYFVCASTVFRSILIEDTFPKIENLFEKNTNYLLEIKRDPLLNALRIINMFNLEKKSSMKFSLAENRLTIENEKSDFGESKNSISCVYDGKKESIGFNIQFFLEGVKSFETSEQEDIFIYFNGNNGPCIIEASDMPGYKYLGMPSILRW